MLTTASYAEANLISRAATGRGVTQQSFALRHRILEVDAVAHQDDRVVEVHPEVSFCRLAGRPLAHSKHSAEGITERRSLLEREGIELPPPPPSVTDHDLLDAAAAAWTARRYARNEAEPLPDGHPERIGAIWG